VPLVAVGAVAFRHWRDYRDIERLVRAHAAAAEATEQPRPAGSDSEIPS
jgi:hypothetical protein